MLNRVQGAAAKLKPERAARAVLLGPFWLTGAAIGSIIALLWTVGKWVTAAAVTGFRDAAPDLPPIPANVVGWVTVLIVVVTVWLW